MISEAPNNLSRPPCVRFAIFFWEGSSSYTATWRRAIAIAVGGVRAEFTVELSSGPTELFNTSDRACYVGRQSRGFHRSVLALFIFLLTYLGLMLLSGASARLARADGDLTAPLSEVKTTINHAVSILHNQQMPMEERRRELRQLAEHHSRKLSRPI